MVKKITNVIALVVMLGVMYCSTFDHVSVVANAVKNDSLYSGVTNNVYDTLHNAENIQLTTEETSVPIVAETEQEEPVYSDYEYVTNFIMDDWEIEMIALLMVAEAEGESEYGKRLVIDTVLNRIDSEIFPNAAHNVIYQPNQYTSMWNGRADRVTFTEYDINLVVEEIMNRTNYDVIFFNANKYSDYGVPLFQEGNHCFSTL